MKYLFLFLLVCCQVVAQEINAVDSQGKKHGQWKGTYADTGRPRYEGTFEHGKETGVFKFYDNTKDGKVIATREFNPKDNSCYTIVYNQNGNKVSEGKLVNRIEEGEWKCYHEDSPQIMTQEFYTKGKLNGIRKVYYKSGKLAEEWGYKKGTVSEVISEILKKANEPLHRDEIVKRVMKNRYVKETTILLNLQGKPQFKRVAKATYALAEE